MANKKNKFLQQQKLAIGAIVAIAVAVVIYFSTLVVTDVPDGEFAEGRHYMKLEEPGKVRGKKDVVMEFFSYGCIHCFNFDPEIEGWVEENSDTVNFVRTPVLGSKLWRLYGQTYYTMQEIGILEEHHVKFFTDIHTARRNLATLDTVAAWFEGRGTTEAEFRLAFESENVKRRMASADAITRAYKISSVPSIVVNGKYHIGINSDVGTARLLEVTEHLLQEDMPVKET
ncbi:MAG: thiol:disulfide interchange protein DsbA [Candidatus Azotimanducaceae bacterium]|jgi:thiol:disulfide interchange protein DsbA